MYIKSFLLERVNADTVRGIVFEEDKEDGARSIYDIIEYQITNGKVRPFARILEDRANFDDWQILGDYDFGRARTLCSKLERAILQEMGL